MSGFVTNGEKSQWDPVQCGELLGFIKDLRSGTFQVPPRRVNALKKLLNATTAKKLAVSARHLSCITGSLVSLGLALGPVAHLWTRALYRDICQTVPWERSFLIYQESQAEVQFWRVNFDAGGYPLWSPSPRIEVITYSDASGQGWGGFAVQLSDKVARGSWSCEESGKSSMFREVTAISCALESFADEVRGK